MPKVNGRHYAYTKAGYAPLNKDKAKAKKKKKKKKKWPVRVV